MGNENNKEEKLTSDSLSLDSTLKKVSFGKVGKKISEINDSYDESTNSLLLLFSPEGYEYPPEPDEDDFIYEKSENGDEVIVGIKPRRIGKNRFEYFYSPQYKARLAKCLVAMLVLFFIMLMSTVFIYADKAAIIFMVVLVLVMLNVFIRYSGVGIAGRPVPVIPFLSSFVASMGNVQEGSDSETEEDNDEEVSSGEIYVTPIEDVRNGNPSPATILTRWMNNEARWTEDDIIENSGGVINRTVVKMLFKNNHEIWTDEDILDTLSSITGSHPKQWVEVYNKWEQSR